MGSSSLGFSREKEPSASAGSPDTCASVLPHRHWPSGRSDRPLAAPRCPQISFMRVWLSATRSFAFATALLVARLAGLTRPEGLNVPSASRGFYIPGFQVTGSPRVPAGYHYGAKLRIAPTGLSPASTAASLAAPPPDHATLDSGWWPALTGQGSHLLGRVEGFRHVYPSTWLPPSPDFAWHNNSLNHWGWPREQISLGLHHPPLIALQ